MPIIDPSRRRRILPLATAFVLCALPAAAQGTDEQREACAPDAVRLCQDTIPDIERTTACMRQHEAELSPRCRTAFSEVTGGRATERRRAARDEDEAVSRPRRVRPPDVDDRRVSREGRREGPRDEEAYPRPPRYRAPDDDEDFAVRDPVPPAYVEPAPRGYVQPGVREYRYLTPGGEEARARDPGDRARARAEISRLCQEGQMDPETCATTDRALGR